MDVFIFIASTDFNGEGYYQDSIEGIYQSESAAQSALEKAESDDLAREPHCGIDTRYFILKRPVI